MTAQVIAFPKREAVAVRAMLARVPVLSDAECEVLMQQFEQLTPWPKPDVA